MPKTKMEREIDEIVRSSLGVGNDYRVVLSDVKGASSTTPWSATVPGLTLPNSSITIQVGEGIVRFGTTGLTTKVEELEKRLAALEEKIRQIGREEEAVEIRDIPRELAKQEISSLFANGETLYMSEVADRLNLPDSLVVELCTELRAEGALQVNDDLLPSR